MLGDASADAEDLLLAVLLLLDLLPRALPLLLQTHPRQPVLRLELLGVLDGVVDKGEPGGSSA